MQTAGARIPELDGLRGIAIALVLIFHAAVYVHIGWRPLGEFAAMGWSGVDLFFVLSGFLIGGILLDQRESLEFFQPFYARRVFRILPPYLAVLAGYALVWTIGAWTIGAWTIGGDPRSELMLSVGTAMPAWVYLTFTNNLFLASHGTHFFLPVTWSLALEEQFYLTLPLLVRYLPRRWLTWLVPSGIVAILCWRAAACAGGSLSQAQIYMLPWFRADGLLVGVGCAMIARSASLAVAVRRYRVVLYLLVASAGFVLWRIGWWLPTEQGTPAVTLMEWGLTLVAVCYGGMLLTAVLACPAWLSAILKWRPLRFLGGVSYFVYLAHQPLLTSALRIVSGLGGQWELAVQWAAAAMAYAITLLLGHLSWKYYESRMIAVGHRSKLKARKQAEAEPAPIEIAA